MNPHDYYDNLRANIDVLEESLLVAKQLAEKSKEDDPVLFLSLEKNFALCKDLRYLCNSLYSDLNEHEKSKVIVKICEISKQMKTDSQNAAHYFQTGSLCPVLDYLQ